jgi:Domain of unknown function (DUF4404)
MNNHQTQQTIAELRAELANLGEGNEATKAHIYKLIDSLEHQLSNPDNDQQPLRENVATTIERLEAEHPRTALILHQIMNMLSGSGI